MKNYIVIFVLVLLSGCQTVIKTPSSELGANKDGASSWYLSGKLSVSSNVDGGSARYIWQHEQNQHAIELYGPLGMGRVLLNQAPNGAQLTNQNQQVFRGETLEALLFRTTRWIIPFAEITHWVDSWYGRELSQQQLNELSNRAFDEWQLTIDDFTEKDSFVFPRKITMIPTTAMLETLNKSSELNDEIEYLKIKMIFQNYAQ